MKAIIYKSQTGFTRAYAMLLSEAIGIPSYDVGEALTVVAKGAPVIFMSWIKAGDIVAYGRISRRYDIKAVAVVGISAAGNEQLDRTRKRHRIKNQDMFYLQGGLLTKNLHSIERKMIQMIQLNLSKSIAKKEKANQQVTKAEQETLNSLVSGGSYVKKENLRDIVKWYEENKA